MSPVPALFSPLRRALREHPDAWLRVDGRNLALTLYGAPSADAIDGLVDLADAVFARHGADTEASLFGDDAVVRKKAKKPSEPEPAASGAAGRSATEA